MAAPRQAARLARCVYCQPKATLRRRATTSSTPTETNKPGAAGPLASSNTRYVKPDTLHAAPKPPAKPLPSVATDVKGKGRAVEADVATAPSPSPAASTSSTLPPSETSASTSETPAATSSAEKTASTSAASSNGSTAHEPFTPRPDSPSLGEAASPLRNPFLSLNIRNPFNTHTFVEKLVEGGWPRERAEILMEAARALAQKELRAAQKTLTSKVSMENDEFLYKAAQAELRNQVQEDTREATIAQRSANALVHRKIDLLRQSMNEQMESSKSEHKYEIQQNRHETSADFKAHDMRWSTIANRITIVATESRYIDERLKFFFAILVLTTTLSICILGFAIAIMMPHHEKLPTIEDLGVKPLPEDRQLSEYDGPMPSLRRVGEEEE